MTAQTDQCLKGKVALVTGGAGAFGLAIGTRLAAAGAKIVLADVNGDRLARAASQVGAATGLAVDVVDANAVRRAVDEIVKGDGRLDIVVNNAGATAPGTNTTMTTSDWERVLNVNLTGTFNVCQAAIPALKESGAGRIVNIGSRVWLSGGSTPAYTTSKAGLIGLTRNLARELGPWNITANVVAPSGSPTGFDLARGLPKADAESGTMCRSTPLGRLCEPADVAGAVYFFASPDASFVSGEILHVSGGAQLAP